MGVLRAAVDHSLAVKISYIRISTDAKRHTSPLLLGVSEELFACMIEKTLTTAEAECVRRELELLKQESPNYKWKHLTDSLLMQMRAHYERNCIRLSFPITISPSLIYAWLTPSPPRTKKTAQDDAAH